MWVRSFVFVFSLVLLFQAQPGFAQNPDSAAQTAELACPQIVVGPKFPEVVKSGFSTYPIAILPAGSAERFPSELSKIRDNGSAKALMIENPDTNDLTQLAQSSNVLVGPMFIEWVRPAVSFEAQVQAREDLNDAKKKKKIDDYKRKLKKTENYQIVVEPLTQELYYEWHPLFVEWVQGKEFGSDTCPAGFFESLQTSGAIANWSIVLIRDQGKAIGGVLLERKPAEKVITVKRAAFNKTPGTYEKAFISWRTYHESIRVAEKEGYQTMSYGTDPAFYGELTSVGLQSFKTSLGFSMIPSTFIKTQRAIEFADPASLPNPRLVIANKDNDPSQPLVVHQYGELPADYAYPRGLEIIQHP